MKNNRKQEKHVKNTHSKFHDNILNSFQIMIFLVHPISQFLNARPPAGPSAAEDGGLYENVISTKVNWLYTVFLEYKGTLFQNNFMRSVFSRL